jgi:molybdate transport system substrate-binding protein
MLRALAIVAMVLTQSGCRGEGGQPATASAPLLVFAASDLQYALPEIAREFEARTGRRAELVFGSTGRLAAQIEHGAPADLFFAADESFVDRLIGTGHLDGETRRPYAVGRIVVVAAPGRSLPASLGGLVGAGTLAIANPEHAPYGRAAAEALRSSGVWDQVRTDAVFGDNIAQTHEYVRTGNADVGIVALSLVAHLENSGHRLIEASLHSPLLQAAAVVRHGEGDPHPDAAAFLEFAVSDLGRRILRRYGFEDPPGG